MKERPILFSAPMIRAILSGVKTQTRRVVKHQWPYLLQEPYYATGKVLTGLSRQPGAWMEFRHRQQDEQGYQGSPASTLVLCPYGQSGDRLRVKEAAWLWCERRPNGTTKTGRQKWRYVPMRAAGVYYAADHRAKPTISVVSPDTGNEWGWRLKIGRFLPAWASRITLEITDVRVERLQDISEADALAEGIVQLKDGGYGLPAGEHYHSSDPRQSYLSLWEAINGPGSVEANPWCWAVGFKRVEVSHG